MTTWNVLVGVVTLETADTREEAVAQVIRKLGAAGFSVYEGQPADAFESDFTP